MYMCDTCTGDIVVEISCPSNTDDTKTAWMRDTKPRLIWPPRLSLCVVSRQQRDWQWRTSQTSRHHYRFNENGNGSSLSSDSVTNALGKYPVYKQRIINNIISQLPRIITAATTNAPFFTTSPVTWYHNSQPSWISCGLRKYCSPYPYWSCPGELVP